MYHQDLPISLCKLLFLCSDLAASFSISFLRKIDSSVSVLLGTNALLLSLLIGTLGDGERVEMDGELQQDDSSRLNNLDIMNKCVGVEIFTFIKHTRLRKSININMQMRTINRIQFCMASTTLHPK